jgi:hypothetical protein
MRNAELPMGNRFEAARELIYYYGDQGKEIVSLWAENLQDVHETSQWHQFWSHMPSSFGEGGAVLAQYGITSNISACVLFACLTGGTGGSSIGFFSAGPGKGPWWMKGFGVAAYGTSGALPSKRTGGLMVCVGVCVGHYWNLDAPGSGWMFGVGTPGVFGGPTCTVKQP